MPRPGNSYASQNQVGRRCFYCFWWRWQSGNFSAPQPNAGSPFHSRGGTVQGLGGLVLMQAGRYEEDGQDAVDPSNGSQLHSCLDSAP
jgi:hypothetical protein